jgi:hypothetical protein
MCRSSTTAIGTVAHLGDADIAAEDNQSVAPPLRARFRKLRRECIDQA